LDRFQHKAAARGTQETQGFHPPYGFCAVLAATCCDT
jgi:hypothetical protein